MRAQDTKPDVVKIRFVDSQERPIPYFASHFEYFSNDRERSAFQAYLRAFPWDELLPYQEVGGGIMPLRSDKESYFVDSIDVGFERERLEAAQKRYKNAGLPEPIRCYVWYFPDNQVYIATFDEINHLNRTAINIITISGDLGSGLWKELGDFLFDAARFWRIDRGSRSALMKRCDALINAKKKAGDMVWAGNLTFVRELWIEGNPRIGLFAREQSSQTTDLDRELPWQHAGREFGREGVAMYSYPLKPYLVFKKVLEVNPGDVRAVFWTRLLPWVNGFSLSDCKTGQTIDDYINECKRVYGDYKDKLDDYHRFWFLREFLRASDGMTYEARWWLKQKGVSHDTDLQWALDELAPLFGKYPFLRYQIPEIKEWLLYMKDSDQVEPLNLIDGK